jgi:cell division protein FtsB
MFKRSSLTLTWARMRARWHRRQWLRRLLLRAAAVAGLIWFAFYLWRAGH